MERITIDQEQVAGQLKAIAGDTPCEVEFHPRQERRCLIRETDNCVNISINSKRVRTQKQLDGVIEFCSASLTFGGI